MRDAMWDEHRVIVNRKRVRRLMKRMGLRGIYPGNKGTSKPNKAHRVYPYLLADLAIHHLLADGQEIRLFDGGNGLALA